MNELRKKSIALFREVQNEICRGLECLEDQDKFVQDPWKRTDLSGDHGGGGETCILNGAVFEKAGVNFSEVWGLLPQEMTEKLLGKSFDAPFYATGISLVIHPYSPLVPTTHANYRFLEVADKCWFGGGADLTPYKIFEEDCRHFHGVLKTCCGCHNHDYYPKFKKWCDEYFYLPHRSECRGIGGIFFDYFGKDDGNPLESGFALVTELSKAFLHSYLPIVSKRKDLPFSEREKAFQLMQRGRYVEFNLLYDRGTQFGLKTGGRAESILMSLPPEARWEYNSKPQTPEEAELLAVLQKPREWCTCLPTVFPTSAATAAAATAATAAEAATTTTAAATAASALE